LDLGSGLCFVKAQGITISKDIVAEGNGGALRSYGLDTYSVVFTGNVSGTSIRHNDGGTHTFSGNVDLETFAADAGVTNFSGTGTNTIGTLTMNAGTTVNFSGTGTNTISALNIYGTSRTISIAEGSTVSVGNINNWNGIATLTVNGELNVSGEMLYSSGDVTNTINGSGTLTAATFTAKNVGTYDFSGGLNTNITTLDVSRPTTFSNTGKNTIGTLTQTAGALNFSGTGTTEISNVTQNGGTFTQTAGTLKLSGENTFTGGVTVTAGTLVAANTKALGSSGTTTVNEGGVLKVSVNGGVNVGEGSVTFNEGAKFAVDLTAYSDVQANTALSIITASAISFNGGNTNTVALISEEIDIESYFSVDDSNLGEWAKYARTWGYENNALTLTLTVPEPSTFGLLAGVGALALVAARRRRRAK